MTSVVVDVTETLSVGISCLS